MAEHVFLCGLSKEQQAEYPTGTILSLEKGVGNLILKLDRMRKRLVGSEPRRLTDFIEIASYVFAADRTTSRGLLTDPEFGALWRRRFRLIIAVRDLSFWQRPHVRAALTDALSFLSEDWWQFQFMDNAHPIPLQEYLDLKPREANSEGGTSVLLFSGGLDSLAGAVHELRTTNRHVVLVSHRNLKMVGTRQRLLAERLVSGFPKRVTHVSVENSLTMKLDREEETQRTRTFFFTAMAAVAAHIEAADRIRFYENGVMSVNLPFATQLVGARTSRSTHPRSLQLMKAVLDLLASHEIDIDNPFAWRTKVEIVRELASTGQAELITGTTSCSRSQFANRRYKHHCGTCVQCLQRRISTLAAGASGLDEAEGYETDFLEGPRTDGEDRVMAVETIKLALDCASISDRDFVGRFAEPLAWVQQAYPMAERDEIGKKTIDLYRRHGEAVRTLFIRATESAAAGVLDRSLPPSSLLALVLKDRLVSPGQGPARETSSSRLPELPSAEPPSATQLDGIVVAVDEPRRRIRIRDQVELHGSVLFPLLRLLIAVSLAERSKPGHPDNFRCLRARSIADELGSSDEVGVRAAIRRARTDLKECADGLGMQFDPNAVIESAKLGYRLNPKVTVVPLEEF